MTSIRFSANEDAFIRKNWGKQDITWIADAVGRDYQTLYARARYRLGLPKLRHTSPVAKQAIGSMIMNHIKLHGTGTGSEIAAAIGKNVLHVRSCLSELNESGDITVVGHRKSTSGNSAWIWGISQIEKEW